MSRLLGCTNVESVLQRRDVNDLVKKSDIWPGIRKKKLSPQHRASDSYVDKLMLLAVRPFLVG